MVLGFSSRSFPTKVSTEKLTFLLTHRLNLFRLHRNFTKIQCFYWDLRFCVLLLLLLLLSKSHEWYKDRERNDERLITKKRRELYREGTYSLSKGKSLLLWLILTGSVIGFQRNDHSSLGSKLEPHKLLGIDKETWRYRSWRYYGGHLVETLIKGWVKRNEDYK